MAAATAALEEAIKEYLLFRGFTETLKNFEAERKGAKEKEYKAQQIVQHLLSCIYNSDLQELKKFWSLLSQKLFSRLASDFKQTLYKLETYLLRLYLVHAKMSGRVDVIRTFFETMSDTLAQRKEWKEWFVFPYSSSPEQHPVFGVYFTREWILTFRVSLKNFFDTVFAYLPKPMLLNFQSEHNKVQALTTETHFLHTQLADTKTALATAESRIQQLEIRLTQQMLNVVNADVKGNTPVRKTSNAALKQKKPTSPEEFAFKRAQSMSSADRPHKKISHSSSTSNDDSVQVSHFGPKLPTNQSNSEERPMKNLTEGVKNVKFYSTIVGGRAPFFAVQQAVYRGHSTSVVHCRFSPNGDNIVSHDTNNVVKIWNSKQPHGTVAATHINKASILSLEWLPNHDNVLLLGMNDGKVKVFNTHSAKLSGDMDCGHDYNQVISIVHQPNSSKFACSATTGLINDKEKAASGLVSPNLPSSKSLEMHSKLQNTIYVWDLSSNSKEAFEPLHVAINSMSFNHNGSLLVTGASDGVIRLYDVHRKELLQKWKAHHGQILKVQYSADESGIFSFGEDNMLVQWSILKAGDKLSEILLDEGTNMERTSNSLSFAGAFSLDLEGKHILVRGRNEAYLYSLQQDYQMVLSAKIFGHAGPLSAVDWTGIRNLNTCITASLDTTVRITTLLRQ